ncbi:MAG: radical SAM protein [Chloroflexota bacterium]|nr:radical SAM protein [Chloroflexota bacterium]
MTSFVSRSRFSDFALWKKIANRRVPMDFYLEITARCNNNCRHCYINLPAGDSEARRNELSLDEIKDIADQAIELGALWCLLTGGEPLLRKDFFEIYMALKKKGLLLSLFTNACLVTEDHIDLFKKYPPRDIEVSVYGVSKETYERVTRKPGSYAAFIRGLDLLLKSGIKIKLKTMAMRSNVHELPEIAAFCRELTDSAFRFDPLLHLRYDQNPTRNKEILDERLTPNEIVAIEQADEARAEAMKNHCEKFIFPESGHYQCNHLFHCGAGNASFVVSYDGIFRLCADLWHPDTIYDLRTGSLTEAWNDLVPRVRDMRSNNPNYLERCRDCPIINLCYWCPAHAYLECGQLDCWVDYYCQIAHARAKALKSAMKSNS